MTETIRVEWACVSSMAARWASLTGSGLLPGQAQPPLTLAPASNGGQACVTRRGVARPDSTRWLRRFKHPARAGRLPGGLG